MPRTLISIVSDQTLPNVLFIKEANDFDKFVFITTPKMERSKRTAAIMDCCKIKEAKRVIVSPENLQEIEAVLQKEHFSEADEYLVNLTGGTKMMAIAVNDFFRKFKAKKVEMFYMPLGQTAIYQVFPSFKIMHLNAKVNLKEYLTAYGVKILKSEKLSLHKRWLPECEQLFDEIQGRDMPYKINMALYRNNLLSEEDKVFYTGKWFEIWTAFKIKEHFKLSDENILINMELTRSLEESKEKTEYDVVFVKENKLFIAECKYFPGNSFKKAKINQDWYKLAGLQLHMGLFATPFFMTANRISPLVRKYMKESHKLFRIKSFADIATLKDEESLSIFLNQL